MERTFAVFLCLATIAATALLCRHKDSPSPAVTIATDYSVGLNGSAEVTAYNVATTYISKTCDAPVLEKPAIAGVNSITILRCNDTKSERTWSSNNSKIQRWNVRIEWQACYLYSKEQSASLSREDAAKASRWFEWDVEVEVSSSGGSWSGRVVKSTKLHDSE